MPRFNRLRGLGPVGNAIALVLTFLTTNWQLVVSVVVAIAAGAVDWLRAIVLNPAIITGAGAFLAALWTIIGISVLIDRRRPRIVRTQRDYRWGLTFEGLAPRYTAPNEPIPDAGSLNFWIMLRNFSQSPVRYEFENIDIRIGTRAIPRIVHGTLIGYMARGAGRTSTIKGFSSNQLKEFYGHGLADATAVRLSFCRHGAWH
jgi:hypothetical protein